MLAGAAAGAGTPCTTAGVPRVRARVRVRVHAGNIRHFGGAGDVHGPARGALRPGRFAGVLTQAGTALPIM